MNDYRKAFGSPTCVKWRGGYLVLHPLTLKEWLFMESLLNSDDDVCVVEAMVHCLYLSIRKAEPLTKKKVLAKFFRKKYNRKAIPMLVKSIAKISLSKPKSDKDKSKDKGENEEKLTVSDILRAFKDHFNMDANQVGDLTPFQVDKYIEIMRDKLIEPLQGMEVNSTAEAQHVLEQIEKLRG